MNNDVIVEVKGMQEGYEYSEQNDVTLPGKYYEKNGKRYIKYEETKEDFNEVIANLVKIDNDSVEVMKSGGISVRMYFKENTKNYTVYDVEGYSMDMSIATNKVRIYEEDGKLHIELDYVLEFENAHPISSKMRIVVTERMI